MDLRILKILLPVTKQTHATPCESLGTTVSQTLLGQSVYLPLHVIRSQLQPGGDAVVVGQRQLGQAFPRSVYETHEGNRQAAEKRARVGVQEATLHTGSDPTRPCFLTSCLLCF